MMMQRRQIAARPAPMSINVKRDPLANTLQNVGTGLGNAVGSIAGHLTGNGGNNGNSGGSSGGGGSGSGSNNGGGSSSGGSSGGNEGGSGNSGGSGSGNSGGSSGSGGSSSGGGSSSSGGSSGSSGGSSGGGGSSSSGGSSSGSGSSSGGGSSSSGGSSGSSGSGGSSNGSGSSSNGGNTGNNSGNNGGSSSPSNGSGSNSNGNGSNNGGRQNLPTTPVTLSNGAVVTPVSIVASGNGGAAIRITSTTLSNGQVVVSSVSSASSDLVVVMTNSDGEQLTSTVAFESVLDAPTGLPTGGLAQESHVEREGKTNPALIVGPIIAVLVALAVGLAVFIGRRRRRRGGSLLYADSSRSRLSSAEADDSVFKRTAHLASTTLPMFKRQASSPSSTGSLTEKDSFTSSPSSEMRALPGLTYIDSEKLSPVTRPVGLLSRMTRQTHNSFALRLSDGSDMSPTAKPVSLPQARGPPRPESAMSAQSTQALLPSLLPHPSSANTERVRSINDAISTGELAYDDEASSLGHGSVTSGITALGLPFVVTAPSMSSYESAHSSVHDAASDESSSAPAEQTFDIRPSYSPQPDAAGQTSNDPFSSPRSSQYSTASPIGSPQSGVHSIAESEGDVKHVEGRVTFRAHPNAMPAIIVEEDEDRCSNTGSADTFGMPQSPSMSRNGSTCSSSLDAFAVFRMGGAPSVQDVPLSFASPNSLSSSAFGSPSLSSPHPSHHPLARTPGVSSIVETRESDDEEEVQDDEGIPVEIINDTESKPRASIWSRFA